MVQSTRLLTLRFLGVFALVVGVAARLGCQSPSKPGSTAALASEEGAAEEVVPGGAAQKDGGNKPEPDGGGSTERKSWAGTQPAPEFPAGLEWLNSEHPLTLAKLKGKVVILDFWTYGCINCIHNLPWLKRLQQEFPEELVVVGVHSAKFIQEGQTENIHAGDH